VLNTLERTIKTMIDQAMKIENSTSHNLTPPPSVEPKQNLLDNLSINIISLMFDEPFWAQIIRNLNIIKTEEIPTAAVSTEDNQIKLYWNPKFVSSLNKKEIKGLLKHEAMHLAFSHTTSRKLQPHTVFNWAADLAINSLIPLEELPKCGLIAGKPLEKPSEEQWKDMSLSEQERFNRLSKFIHSLPSHKSTEWYFDKLMSDEQIKNDIQSNNKKFILDLDSHDKWSNSGEVDKDLSQDIADKKIKNIIAEAVKNADMNNSWGSISSDVRTKIRQSLEKTVNWTTVLKYFCGSKQKSIARSSWSKINTKYAGAAPGKKKKYTSSIAIYIDQSASVTDEALGLIFAELAKLSHKVEFTTFHFDTLVDLESETLWKRGKAVEAIRTKMGGTCFNAPTEHCNQLKKKYDGCIIITDGEATKPKTSFVKRLWLIIPNRKLLFAPDFKDVVVQM
jgi:predicted metal-dependent peptidase